LYNVTERNDLSQSSGQSSTRAECPAHGGSAALWLGRSLRRWLFAFLGVVSVGVGFIGVFVPGLPTTIFLILASYLFTRSCPWLEQKLVRSPVFKPYLRYLDGDRAMPVRARVATIAMIWVAVSTSCALMAWRGTLSPVFVAVVGGLALIGSVVVAVVYRGR
jgi:uncharacterized membrane protein YbaN (DUF454 family)